jgi:hypothetical protein
MAIGDMADPGALDARPLQRGCGGDAAELDRRDGGQAAAEGADGGARGAEDHDVGHGLFLLMLAAS